MSDRLEGDGARFSRRELAQSLDTPQRRQSDLHR